MPVVAAGKFLECLRASRLLTDAQFQELQSEARRNPAAAPHELARWLVDRHVITRWQAKMLLSGRTAFFLGKYKLLSELGHGGMGAVFQAQQAPLGRIVALKVMAQKLLENPGAVARFEREIQASAALQHPNIVTAFDADRVQNTHFLVMEYVAGQSLDDVLKREKRLPIATGCEYVRQAALGLQHAHERGMAHRDIKPSNLLVTGTSDGEPLVKILDMGLARFTSESRESGELTTTGQILGTPDYIAPEQAKNTKSADIRSDIFSLGCTLFRALTGRIPFGGESIMEKLSSRLLDDAPKLRTLLPEAPAKLEAVIQKMLTRDPAQRFQTPAEVATALSLFARPDAAGGPSVVPAAPAASLTADDFSSTSDPAVNLFLEDLRHEAQLDETAEPGGIVQQAGGETVAHAQVGVAHKQRTIRGAVEVRRQVQKKREIAAAVAILALLGAALAWWGWHKAGEATVVVDWPESERSEATLIVDGTRYSLRLKGPLKYRVEPGQRTIRLKREGYEEIDESLVLARREERRFVPEWQPLPQTARKLSWDALQARTRKVIGRLKQFSGLDSALADPDVVKLRGELVQYGRTNPGTKESLVAARLMRRLPWPIDLLTRDSVPPDALRRAEHGDPAQAPAEIVAILGESRLKMWGQGYSVAVNPDGKIAAAAGQYESAIYLFDTQTGELLRKLPVRGGPCCTAFSGDGARVCCGGHGIFVWDALSGELIADLPGMDVVSASLNGDGSRVVASGNDGHVIQLWDVNTKEKLWDQDFRDAQLRNVGISADGRFVANSRFPEGVVEIRDGARGEMFRQIPADIYVPMRFTPDGSLLFVCTENTYIQAWATAGWTLQSEFFGNGQKLEAVDGNGRRCLTSCPTEVAFWDVGSGERLWDSSPGTYLVRGALNRDGTRAVSLDNTGGLAVWDTATGQQAVATNRPFSAILSVRVSPDGGGVIVGGTDGALLRWNFGQAQPQYVLGSHPAGAIVLGYNASGDTIFSAGADDGIRSWDFATGTARNVIATKHSFAAHMILPYRNSIVVSPEGRHAACAEAPDMNRIILFDQESRRQRILVGHGARLDVLTFSADGTRLAGGGLRTATITIWDVSSGRELQSLKLTGTNGRAGVWCLAFAPSGGQLFAGGDAFGGNLTVWDPDTGAKVADWEGHRLPIDDIAVSPDGETVATAAGDGQVILWNTGNKWADQERTISLTPERAFINQIDFTPDGRHLVTANGNGTVYVLRLKPWLPESDSE